jgi:hypothetical protein
MDVIGHKRDQEAVWLDVYTINKAPDNHGKEMVGQPLKKSLFKKRNKEYSS